MKATLHILRLLEVPFLYGKDQGDEPAGMFQLGDSPEMLPGSRTITVDGQDVNKIWDEMQVRLAAFNALLNSKTAMLTFPVVSHTEKVGVPSNPGFQDATELGRPTKVRVQEVTRGYGLKHFDLGYGYTQEYIDYATSAQILAVQAEVFTAYAALQRNKVMEAMFTETNTTQEAISIKRLYNGDGEIPPSFKRWTFAGTHTHYLEDASATVTADICDEMELHLVHHGFGTFGETFVLHANRSEMGDLRSLTDFVPAESADRPAIISGPIVGPTGGISGPLVAQGYFHRWSVTEDNDIPAGYLMGYATGGTFAQRNVVGMRAHENPSARGLRLAEGPNGRYPLIDAVYDTYVGTGIRQRGAAVLMMIDSANWVDPSFDGYL